MAELADLMCDKKLTVPKLHSKLLISGLQVSRDTLKSWVYSKRNPKPEMLAKVVAVIAASPPEEEQQLVEIRCKQDHGHGRPCLSLAVKGLDRNASGEKLWIKPFLRPSDGSLKSTFSGRLPVTGNMIFRRRCEDVACFDRIFAFCGDDAIIMKVALERSSS